MKPTFEQKLGAVFGLIVAGILVIGLLTFRNNHQLNTNHLWTRHTQEVLRQADLVLNLTRDIAGERAYLTTRDTEFIQGYLNSKDIVLVQLGVLKDLTKDNPNQQKQVDTVTQLTQKRINLVEKSINLIDQDKTQEAETIIASKESKHLFDNIRRIIGDVKNEENELLTRRQAASDLSLERSNYTLIALFGALLFVLIGMYLAIKYNLSWRKEKETEVNQTNRFLNTILENLPNMIFVKDAENLRFVRFNRAGERLLGKKRDELIGKNDYDFFPKEQADFFTQKDKEVLANGILVDIEEEPIETPTGRHWLHTKKIPIADETGRPKYLLGISEDISSNRRTKDEIKHLNEDLQKTIEQLLQANKEMEAFTYSVSHDLRAPLRIIDGFGEIMLKDYGTQLDDEGIRNLNVIMSNAKHMGQLIDDLLNLSRLGRAQLTVKPVDMQDMVEDIIAATRVSEPQMKAEITVRNLPSLQCDPSLMRQVWVNLISNAVKYSRKNNEPKIEIGSVNKEGKIVYFIKDNGVGFDMRYSHKLFGVFQRLHKLSEFEGTGVGLALVHRIIAKHGGTIWAEASINNGASFFFTVN